MNSTEAGTGLYCGADLHGNNVLLSVCDQSGAVVFERRVKCRLDAVNGALSPYWDRIVAVGVESTFNWYWFVDGLRAQGRPVKLANPAKMEQYAGLKVTDDESDARWIATQLRLGILPECYVCPPELRAVRDTLRRRMLIARQRTRALLCLESLLERYGLAAPSAQKLKKNWTQQDVKNLGLEEYVELQASSLLDLAQKADKLAVQIERRVLARVKPTEDYKRLQQLPGVGPTLGMVIALETGDIGRFADAGRYASYTRGVASHRSSNNKKKGENNRKNGNAYLAWAFSEAATFAIRYNPQIAAWYDRKKRRRNRPVAMRALACKLAKAAWYVLQGNDYEESLLFG